jgi:hypothetical protein
MGWSVDVEDESSVSLVHDEGFLLYAKRGVEHEDYAEWTVEITDTDTGEEIEHESYEISNHQHLQSVLDKYTEIYPP